MDAFSGLADQASDMLMLYEFAKAEDCSFFFRVGLASMISMPVCAWVYV